MGCHVRTDSVDEKEKYRIVSPQYAGRRGSDKNAALIQLQVRYTNS